MPRGRPPKSHDNTMVQQHLQPFLSWASADRCIPGLQDVLSGACSASRESYTSNWKPFSMRDVFWLLLTLPQIDTKSVMTVHKCKEANARKLCQVLRVASTTLQDLVADRDVDDVFDILAGDWYCDGFESVAGAVDLRTACFA